MVVYATITPFSAPIPIPIIRHKITTTITDRPVVSNKIAAITPVNATLAPTDRSIPPAISTMVIAEAKKILLDICLNTLSIFLLVIITGDLNATTTKIATRPNKRPRFSFIKPMIPPINFCIIFFLY